MDFLLEAAQCFHQHGHSGDACSVCHIMDSVAQSSPQLLALELEILGSTKQPDKIWKLIDEVNDLFNIMHNACTCSYMCINFDLALSLFFRIMVVI